MRSLSRVLTRDALLRLAGDLSFERGEEYAAADRVRRVLAEAGAAAVTAIVHGTQEYRVRLRARGGALEGECSCPFAAEGMFCKHCVAAGLAWLKGRAEVVPSPSRDLASLLRGLDKEQLVRVVAEEADEHRETVGRRRSACRRPGARPLARVELPRDRERLPRGQPR